MRGKHLDSKLEETTWQYAIPGTVGEVSIEVACGRYDTGVKVKTDSLVELVKKGKEIIKEEASKKEKAY